jgi:hypothetical protein
MAVWYYPAGNRGAATKIVTIPLFEAAPSRFPKFTHQFVDVMADGTKKQQDLGNARQEIVLNIKNLVLAYKNALVDFIENYTDYSSENFDWDADDGTQYDNLFFLIRKNDFRKHNVTLFDEQIRMIVEPT